MYGSVSLIFRVLVALAFVNHFTIAIKISQSSCLRSQYRCATGNCIPLYSVCDGFRGCWDGSDETEEACDSVTIKREKEGCTLPEQPHNGNYVSLVCLSGDDRTACRNIPGTPVPENWLLEYKCDANFIINSTESEYSVCLNGEWKNPLSCILKHNLCPPLVSIDKNIVCEYNGREVPCTESMRPNTKASISCKPHYEKIFTISYNTTTCLESGEWSQRLFYCLPECGIPRKIDNFSLEPHITRGSSTYHGQFPWLAAIYMLNENNKWDFRCAGTLIHTHIILTAAHCLLDEISGDRIPPENIKVGLGKYYRYYYKEENNSVISDVSRTIVNIFYIDTSDFFGSEIEDIGLIDLKTSVLLTDYIKPACTDWLHPATYKTGVIGQVAGWGATEYGFSSNVIQSTNLIYVERAECLQSLDDSQKKLDTPDKFCGKVAESGGQVDPGFNGGGLIIVKNGLHYVKGVMSTKISDKTNISFFSGLNNLETVVFLFRQNIRLSNSSTHPIDWM